MKKQDKGTVGKMVALGASVAALGAATYYFFGPEGKKHQKNFKGWMIKMKADIVEKIEEAGEVTEAVYHKIIDEVSAAYVKTGKVSKEEIAVYAELLKKQWGSVVKSTKKPVKRAVKKVKAPIEHIAKKIAKKVAKKK